MNAITVSQVNTYIKSLLDDAVILRNIYIVGEISNFRHYTKSGHMYFTLKDEKGQLKCVMFASSAVRLKFSPEDGMRVICRGRISVFERDGVYQLYAEDMQPDGLGALSLAYEQLKERLAAEGLFDSIHKKPIPSYPSKIGVATSNTGAAVEDIKNITQRRYPLCEIVISPTVVQGEQAVSDIVRSLKILDAMPDIDLIIVGRGGGSLEDLWAFNTEPVARAVFECKKPVISAVGHETDYTICDYVADLRAPTPSAAAELAVPDIRVLKDYLDSAEYTMADYLKRRLNDECQHLDNLIYNSVLAEPDKYYINLQNEIDDFEKNMLGSIDNYTDRLSRNFSAIVGRLDALSPLAVLSRGYSVITDCNDNVIKSKNDISECDIINLTFSDGSIGVKIDEVKYEQ